MNFSSSSPKRPGAIFAGIFSLALASVLLLCGAGSVPIQNLLPQGAMQGDLNAGGHSITNAATVAATGSITAPTITSTNFVGNGASLTNITLGGGAGGDLSGTFPNPTVAKFNGQSPGYYLAYGNLTGTPTLGSGVLSALGNAVGSLNGLVQLNAGGNLIFPGNITELLADTSGNLYSNLTAGSILKSGGGGLGNPIVAASVTGTGNIVQATSPTLVTPSIAKLANLTTNGFVKTTSGDGTLSIDTSTYVPTSTTVNGHALSGNVTVSASDIAGAAASGANADITSTTALNTITSASSTDLFLKGSGTGAALTLKNGSNGGILLTPNGTGSVGINAATPGPALLDIGGYGSPAVVNSSAFAFGAKQSYNGIFGCEVENSNTSTAADTRFAMVANDGSYVTFAIPGTGNTGGALLGMTRSSTAYLFQAAGTGGARDFAIGTAGARDLVFATNNSLKGRLYSSGGFYLGTSPSDSGAGNFQLEGNVIIGAAGKTMTIKSGSNALAGTVTLSSGAGTITSTAIDANTVIMFSLKTVSGTPGTSPPTALVLSGSATVTGLSTDNSIYNWAAIKVN